LRLGVPFLQRERLVGVRAPPLLGFSSDVSLLFSLLLALPFKQCQLLPMLLFGLHIIGNKA
jgi:hypothetical protein